VHILYSPVITTFEYRAPAAAKALLQRAIALQREALFPSTETATRQAHDCSLLLSRNSSSSSNSSKVLAKVVIAVSSDATALPTIAADEGYTLHLDWEGGGGAGDGGGGAGVGGRLVGAAVVARTVFGALHALRTLAQLLHPAAGGTSGSSRLNECPTATALPTIIEDAPRFAYRGFIVDVAHIFMPLVQLQRLVVAMSLVKLNVLHLHLTDTQAFRFEVTALPGLAASASRGVYSRTELKRLVQHAYLHGVLVLPELDIPGHAGGWKGRGGVPAEAVLTGRFASTGKTSDQLNPRSGAGAVQLVQQILAEMVADGLGADGADGADGGPGADGAAVHSEHAGGEHVDGEHAVVVTEAAAGGRPRLMPYLHIGGDEVDLAAYSTDPVAALQEWKAFDSEVRAGAPLQQYERAGGRVVQWEEAFALQPAHSNTIIEVWRGVEPNHTLLDVVAAGHTAIVTNIHYLYLDKQFLRPWRAVYKFDFLRSGSQSKPSGAVIPARYHAQVLGGEAGCWGGCMPASGNPEQLPWEALIAVAERLWSPPPTAASAATLDQRHARTMHLYFTSFAA
jgi:hexosaminidase